MTKSLEIEPVVANKVIAFPEERAQDLFDSAVAIAEATGKRVQLVADRNGNANFLIGDKRLRTTKPDRKMTEGLVHSIK